MSILSLKIFKLAFTGLKTNITRTALSVLGIVIGVAAVIVIVSVGQGLKSLILGQFEAVGPNLMSVAIKIPGSDYSNSIRSMTEGVVITTLKASDAEALRDEKRFPYIVSASGYSAAQEWAKYQNEEKQVLIIGADSFYPEVNLQIKVERGRFYTEAENKGMARVVIIGSDIAEKFFGDDDPLGKQIKIKQNSYEVKGVLESMGSSFGFNMDEMVIIPIYTVQKLILGVDHILEVGIQIEDKKYFPQARVEVAQLLRQRHNINDPKNDDFELVTMDQAVEIIGSITNAISLLLGLLAAISLLVGGIGVMNTMFVIVTERTREIGLRKSLGARNDDILSQFVLEAVLISLAGGIIGVFIGIFISYIMTYAINAFGFDWPFVVSFGAIIISFSVATLFGVVFGWYPAKKAAKLNPIEALRYE
ncbi:ABC transporter permease [Candidatus Parcubacteria bacterium]|nr:ABC transporter permease [Candidatus Parcubacteria bacterium]